MGGDIIVIRVGDVLKVTYGATGSNVLMKYSKNLVTGQAVALLKGDKGVETNLLCDTDMIYVHSKFNTIEGVLISTNSILFDKLEEMLVVAV